MRYIEEGATYAIEIPENYIFEKGPDGFTIADVRNYWKGRLFKVNQNGCLGIKYARGYIVKEDGYPLHTDRPRCGEVGIERCWLGKLVKHCHQVEHYIKLQEKEDYTSPFDGEVR